VENFCLANRSLTGHGPGLLTTFALCMMLQLATGSE